jgi:DnaK suppressor protein
VKAPATRTATSGKSAAARARPAPAARTQAAAKPVAPKPAKAATKAPRSAAGKAKAPAAKAPAAKAPAKVAAKASAKAVSKTVAKTTDKTAARAAGQPATKAVTKAVAKTVPKATAASTRPVKAATSPARPGAVAVKPAAPVRSGPAKAPRASVVPAQPVAVKKPSPPADSTPKRPAPAPTVAPVAAAVVIEPSPRPMGKRAAKKAMLEQMTQAAVVPSHAPDAAKATFSTLNERPVMTTSVPSPLQKDPKRANNWKSVPVEQLSDQDILSMPDSEYMNDVQLSFFRRKLSQLKSDMLANAGETTEHLREDTVVVPDPADRATIEEEHALELRTRDRERKLLKKIEQAIARIDAGDYGYCDETGEPIGVGRLLARPTASLSLEAQQRRELKQKMFGD